MKNRLWLIGGLLAVAIIAVAVFTSYKLNSIKNDSHAPAAAIDPKNATYLIDGRSVTLINGLSEIALEPGSDTKTITRYFGNEAKGDLNGDGREDVAFLLTRDGGGSGTFFYVAVALNMVNGYQGLNAILLGDRIAPQPTQIAKGVVTVNYATRNPGEPMSAQPSVGTSQFFRVKDNKLVELANLLDLQGVTSINNTLDLSGQQLEKVPDYVFKQTNLEVLNLSANRLSGSIQAEIRNLVNLKVLILSSNLLTGVPAEIGQLSQLTTLDLSNNQLTGLPYELGNLKNLKVLNISGNQYSEADLKVILSKLPAGVEIIK